MIKNKLSISFIIILCIIFNIKYVGADTVGGPATTSSPGDSGTPGPSGPSGPPSGPGSIDCGGGLTATCWSTTSSSSWSYITVDMYDMNGNEITGIFSSTPNLSALAGTYVSLDVYERKGYSITVNTGATGIQEYKNCHSERWGVTGCAKANKNGICIQDSYGWIWNSSGRYKEKCPASGGGLLWYEDSTEYEWATACTAAYETCKSKAKPSRQSINPSYVVEYRDSNDIDETSGDGKYKTSKSVNATHRGTTDNSSDGSYYWILWEEATFHYNREKTCINVKTGKVRYIGKYDSCNSSEEYTITSKDGYWKYFIPLNANSSDGFSLSMKSNGNKESVAICKMFIDKYDYFANIISNSQQVNTLPRVTSSFSDSKIPNKKTAAGRMVESAGGCYYITTATIPIEQKFYNEVNGGNNFKGFNFYYKPIDITNPFPNGINSTSIWNGWDASKLDISKSYDKVTYIANTSGNENTIRNYTASHKYTSWDNMYVSGKSGFIEKEGIVVRNVADDSFYALGCGPKNTNVTNAFQQTECDNS